MHFSSNYAQLCQQRRDCLHYMAVDTMGIQGRHQTHWAWHTALIAGPAEPFTSKPGANVGRTARKIGLMTHLCHGVQQQQAAEATSV